MRCAACGQENPAGFRFCGSCGALLDDDAPALREVRKVVTVVFCDLAGSTALGDRVDPEALRTTMRSYYEEMRTILERHGGTVEKFVGDAVMAVFGVPVAHEDDAVRAVRAAWEMRAAVPALGLEARIGVNTGEVVTGEGDTLVTGDAVNVAARLEQAAAPGQVLLGAETRRLVRDAVRVEPTLVEAKGKGLPVEAYLLEDVDAGAEPVARRLDAPLVGRRLERQRLRSAYEQVVFDRTCRLFTLLGTAGVGKSRLALDFLTSVTDTTVVRGRCLPYGDGITYWPLVEIVLALGGDVAQVVGSSASDTQLAFRRLLETRAGEGPLVVVVDDLQWAEPPFLDALEHVADWSRGAPILLLCIARPELLDDRPSWGGGKLNAETILLEPLGDDDVEELLAGLLDGAELDGETHRRLLASAQGNPLFVEEMVAMLRETDTAAAVPPTIHALLQARLDRLAVEDRTVIERGAVEGEVFHRGAVLALAAESDREDVPQRLLSLVRKELIRPSTGSFADDDAFRFRHLLVRDAAYDALPKRTRAELHERFARWVDRRGGLIEGDEIVGYHLEQATRYRAELGEHDAALAEEAAGRLAGAAAAAAARADHGAVRKLALRAFELTEAGSKTRLAFVPHAFYALSAGADLAAAAALVDELRQHDDERSRGYALLLAAELAWLHGDKIPLDEDAVRRHFETAGDEEGLAVLCRYLGFEQWQQLKATSSGRLYAEGVEHALRAGAPGLAKELRRRATSVLVQGMTPVDELVGLVEEADMPMAFGRLHAMRGDFAAAWAENARSRDEALERGDLITAIGTAHTALFIAQHDGNIERAVPDLLQAMEDYERLEERIYISTSGMNLAFALERVGRVAEAEAAVERSEQLSAPGDVVDVAGLAAVRAALASRRGDAETALAELRLAIETDEPLELFQLRGWIYETAVHVHARLGQRDEALAWGKRALELMSHKGDVAWGARIGELLAELPA
jgi:class 3 adenylate cyclase/tetratricopeptide (TPR) repeat protein